MCRYSWNPGVSNFWNPQGLSRPVMGMLLLNQVSSLGWRIRMTLLHVLCGVGLIDVVTWWSQRLPQFLEIVRRTHARSYKGMCGTQTHRKSYRSFATRMSQSKIWNFWVIGIRRSICRCTFKRYSVIMQFVNLASGEQLYRRCTHRKLWHFKIFKRFSWKITNFELWHCCGKWEICWLW
jgi:hypothetical protein